MPVFLILLIMGTELVIVEFTSQKISHAAAVASRSAALSGGTSEPVSLVEQVESMANSAALNVSICPAGGNCEVNSAGFPGQWMLLQIEKRFNLLGAFQFTVRSRQTFRNERLSYVTLQSPESQIAAALKFRGQIPSR